MLEFTAASQPLSQSQSVEFTSTFVFFIFISAYLFQQTAGMGQSTAFGGTTRLMSPVVTKHLRALQVDGAAANGMRINIVCPLLK